MCITYVVRNIYMILWICILQDSYQVMSILYIKLVSRRLGESINLEPLIASMTPPPSSRSMVLMINSRIVVH